jgi:hypothetical protein
LRKRFRIDNYAWNHVHALVQESEGTMIAVTKKPPAAIGRDLHVGTFGNCVERKRPIDKLLRFCFLLDWMAIAIRESDAALEGDELSQIGDGKFPGQAIELSARRNCVLAIREHAG